jgi:4-methyl-5(b-hydroxyethyl)-thiazole monophosphate biosynthesis
VKSSNGVTVTADKLIAELPYGIPEAVILPGGMPGALNLRNSEKVCDITLKTANANNIVAAICAAPFVLGELGLLNGKNAVCYPGFEDKLLGAKISSDRVVRDSNFITAAGMGVALPFSFELTAALCGKAKADSIMESIMCRNER